MLSCRAADANNERGLMDWADYLRDEAAKYRQLAETAEDVCIKQELHVAIAAARRPSVRHRRVYNIEVERVEDWATRLERSCSVGGVFL